MSFFFKAPVALSASSPIDISFHRHIHDGAMLFRRAALYISALISAFNRQQEGRIVNASISQYS